MTADIRLLKSLDDVWTAAKELIDQENQSCDHADLDQSSPPGRDKRWRSCYFRVQRFLLLPIS